MNDDGALKCPACGSADVDRNSKRLAIVRLAAAEPAAPTMPPYGCQNPKCGTLFYPSGCRVRNHGPRSSDVKGEYLLVDLPANDLDDASIGPDGWLCVYYGGANVERYVSVSPDETPRTCAELAHRLEASAPAAAGDCAVGGSLRLLSLLRAAFETGTLSGRDAFIEFLNLKQIKHETFVAY